MLLLRHGFGEGKQERLEFAMMNQCCNFLQVQLVIVILNSKLYIYIYEYIYRNAILEMDILVHTRVVFLKLFRVSCIYRVCIVY